MIGKINIKFSDELPTSIKDSLNKFIEALQNEEIEIPTVPNSFSTEIIIEIVEMGNISDKNIKKPLKTLFENKEFNNLSVKLADDEKEFILPEAIEEAIDWFIIE